MIRYLLINPIIPIHPIPVLPVFASTIHFFLDAAFLDEVTLLPFNEAANKNVALMDKRDCDVSDGLIRTLLNLFSVNSGIEMLFAKGASLNTSRVVVCPLL